MKLEDFYYFSIMKLKSLFFLLFVVLLGKINAQEKEGTIRDYPKSIIELGAGVGANHGMYGFKVVLGYKGTGLIIGLGADQSQFASQVGFQVSYHNYFLSLSQGVYGHFKKLSETVLARGHILMGGVKINLNKAKLFYLELGAGYGYGDSYKVNRRHQDFDRILYNIGIGVRIG